MPRDNVITKRTKNGKEYDVRDTPCNIELERISYSESVEIEDYGAFPVHHIYVTCDEIKENLLPLKANPREPSRSPQVRDMEETLKNEPENFVKKNNGMTILCSNVSSDEGKVVLEFGGGREGVCNGAHTYFAIQNTETDPNNKPVVLLEAIEIPDDLEGEERHNAMVEIARARNSNTSLQKKSEADFLGFYDHLKEALSDEKVVSWHEGDSKAYNDAIDAPHLLRMIYSVDPKEFYHPLYNNEAGTHKRAVTSRSKLHRKWFKQMKRFQMGERRTRPQEYMVPLLSDILEIRDMLGYSLYQDKFDIGLRKTSLYKEYLLGENEENKTELRFGEYEGETGIDIPNQMEIILLGLFRTNMYIFPSKEEQKQVSGWVKDPAELWDQRKDKVMERMIKYFNDAGKEPREFPRRSAPYENNLYSYGMDPKVEDIEPEILYEIETRNKFVRSNSGGTRIFDRESKGLQKASASDLSKGPKYKRASE